MKRILILLLAFIMILTMTACKGGEAGNGNGESFDISVCFASEPTTIDPALNTAVDGAIMLNHVFEGLMKWVDDGNGNAVLAPGIAKEYDLSDDKLVYTFYLREGVLWSDGEPVTAYDFEYAWKRLVDPDTAAETLIHSMADRIISSVSRPFTEMNGKRLRVMRSWQECPEIRFLRPSRYRMLLRPCPLPLKPTVCS